MITYIKFTECCCVLFILCYPIMEIRKLYSDTFACTHTERLTQTHTIRGKKEYCELRQHRSRRHRRPKHFRIILFSHGFMNKWTHKFVSFNNIHSNKHDLTAFFGIKFRTAWRTNIFRLEIQWDLPKSADLKWTRFQRVNGNRCLKLSNCHNLNNNFI